VRGSTAIHAHVHLDLNSAARFAGSDGKGAYLSASDAHSAGTTIWRGKRAWLSRLGMALLNVEISLRWSLKLQTRNIALHCLFQ
jgi:hypothetical protein